MLLFRRPNSDDWFFTLLCVVGFSVLALPFGILSGFYEWAPSADIANIARTAAIALILPAFFEELVFRGPLIWFQEKRKRVPVWVIGLSLVAFIAWHPLNAFTFLPQAADVFLDGRFLVIATLLGSFATLIALKTRSLWPAIAFHWVPVVAWKTLFGAPGFL